MSNIAATLSLNVPAITALCQGPQGYSLLNGAGAPTGTVGRDGDFYLDTTVYYIYGPKTLGSWGPGTALNNSLNAPKWDSTHDTVYALSGTWNEIIPVYTIVNSQSAIIANNSDKWISVYSTVSANSGVAWNYQGTDLRALTSNYQSAYSTVSANSGTWGTGGGGGSGDPAVNALVHSNSAGWNSSSTKVNASSANWDSVYSTIYGTSGTWQNNFTVLNTISSSIIQAYSGNWQAVYSTVFSTSGSWNTAALAGNVYATVNRLSGDWQYTTNLSMAQATAWGNASYAFIAVSGRYDNTYLTVNVLSGDFYDFLNSYNGLAPNWQSTFNTVSSLSSNWQSTYSTVTAISAVGVTDVTTSPTMYTVALSDTNRTLHFDTTSNQLTAVLNTNNLTEGFSVSFNNIGTNKLVLSAYPNAIRGIGSIITTQYGTAFAYVHNSYVYVTGRF